MCLEKLFLAFWDRVCGRPGVGEGAAVKGGLREGECCSFLKTQPSRNNNRPKTKPRRAAAALFTARPRARQDPSSSNTLGDSNACSDR
jgi:hypothetical protein